MVAAFQGAGKQAGLQIWRIENFEPVPYPKGDYGKFHCGDSYIVLHTQEWKGNVSWDIHFWLGNETSQDEAGAAAIMSVELDEALGGSPTQHREVQDHESSLFLGYFKAGIRYLPGGVASGFQHVDPSSVEKRLFHVKGKRNVRVKQVPVNVSSMNEGDCFILDAGKNIYLYVGKDSKRTERLKAITFANQIRDEDHAGRGQIQILDETSSSGERDAFFEELGSGSADEVPREEIGGDDASFEKNAQSGVRLFVVSDSDGSLQLQELSERPLHQDLLRSGDCFILDTITSGIYVWIGKQCSKQEKLEAMKRAESFLTQNNYPSWTEIRRVVEGAEGSAFKQYFDGWRETSDLPSSRLFHCYIPPWDASKIRIQEISNFSQQDLQVDDVMILDSRDKIYVWIGNESSELEKSQSVHAADKYLQSDPTRRDRSQSDVLVIKQGEEPASFKALFQNWNDNLWESLPSYEDVKKEIASRNSAAED